MNIHYHKKSGARRLLSSSSGFTLLEILIALTIVTGVIGVSFVGYTLAAENGKAGAVAAAVDSARKAVSQLANERGNSIPITESTTAGEIPVTGTAFSAATPAALSAAITLDTVLLTEKASERALNLNVGPNAPGTNPTAADALWNPSTGVFYMTPDAAPTRSYANSNRLECRMSAATAPATALGANFYLDGTTGLATGRRVVYMVIPNCPASLAYKISSKIDGANFSTSETLADAKGTVVYNTPTLGATTVYIYILDV